MRKNRLTACLLLAVFTVCAMIADRAHADAPTQQLVLASYKLFNDSSTATCVAFHTEDKEGKTIRFVVTANHVLQKMKGDTCVLVSRREHAPGRFVRADLPVTIRRNGKQVWIRHPRHDLAILQVDHEIGTLPLDSLAKPDQVNNEFVGDMVRLAVFPERMEANPAGFPILRKGTIASYPIAPAKQNPVFMVDTTTWSGDSGGPISHAAQRSESDGPLIIGIVRGMRSVTDTTRESRFVEKRMHYPLDIGEAMHASLVWDVIPADWK